jgi:uncharacterized membrane protein YbjE (DUF340 family)
MGQDRLVKAHASTTFRKASDKSDKMIGAPKLLRSAIWGAIVFGATTIIIAKTECSFFLLLLVGVPIDWIDKIIGEDFVLRHPLLDGLALATILNAVIGAILFFLARCLWVWNHNMGYAERRLEKDRQQRH